MHATLPLNLCSSSNLDHPRAEITAVRHHAQLDVGYFSLHLKTNAPSFPPQFPIKVKLVG